MSAVAFVIAILIILLGIVLVASAIRVVPEYQRLVVLRLGRLVGVRGPGLVLLIPVVDRGIRTASVCSTLPRRPASPRTTPRCPSIF